ncbi:MAG: hypothetical protein FJ297_01080 [Planctomycetes bacterium]|nr:hypothetical protein [Planctomycetota bacterium]
MSVGPTNLASGVAATQLAQPRASEDRGATEAADAARRLESNRSAERAEGIGQTREESETHDRDADGRRLWEKAAAKRSGSDESAAAETADRPAASRDPTGQRGQQLDLSG